jgi:serine/threonine-protein kinase
MGEHQWKAGRVLAGRYRLEARLGEGGMGAIWRAQHLVLAAPVAIKLMDPEIAGDADTIARFMREAQAAATLRSPHVVQIIDYGMDGLVPFMVMELLEGETLADRIRKAGRLSASETVQIVTQIARAVHRAHEAGIVHRDLKPENVFLVHNQDEDVAKVLDFGVAKVNVSHLGPSGARTKTGSLLGTPFYMSPEQAQGNKAVDHRSDLWALGVIAFEMLTGQKPFYSDGLGELVLQICVRDIPVPSTIAPLPAAFDAWFARATARDPEQRFQSAKELSEQLRESLGIEARETFGTLPDVADSARSLIASQPQQAQPGIVAPFTGPPPSTFRAMGIEEDPAHPSRAPTLLLGSNKASLTVKQFGTTSHTAPPRRGNTSAILFGVAASALVIGLAGGVVLLRYRSSDDPDRPLPEVDPAATATGELAPAPSQVAPEERPEAADAPAAVPAEGATVPDAARGAEAPSEAKPRAEEPRPVVPEASPPSSAPAAADGGWVKPEWARPDDEPPGRPNEPEPPPMPPSNAAPPAP